MTSLFEMLHALLVISSFYAHIQSLLLVYKIKMTAMNNLARQLRQIFFPLGDKSYSMFLHTWPGIPDEVYIWWHHKATCAPLNCLRASLFITVFSVIKMSFPMLNITHWGYNDAISVSTLFTFYLGKYDKNKQRESKLFQALVTSLWHHRFTCAPKRNKIFPSFLGEFFFKK